MRITHAFHATKKDEDRSGYFIMSKQHLPDNIDFFSLFLNAYEKARETAAKYAAQGCTFSAAIIGQNHIQRFYTGDSPIYAKGIDSTACCLIEPHDGFIKMNENLSPGMAAGL